MTCIVAVKKNGNIYMGGDSAAISDYDAMSTVNEKVFFLGEMLIGYTYSFRMGQLIQYNLELPEPQKPRPSGFDAYIGDEDMRYMVSQFIPAVRQCLKDGGYTKIENNTEEGGQFLVGYRGSIYKIDTDFQVLESTRPFHAIGCGAPYAMGLLQGIGIKKPNRAVCEALQAAGEFSAGVRPPYYVFQSRHNIRCSVEDTPNLDIGLPQDYLESLRSLTGENQTGPEYYWEAVVDAVPDGKTERLKYMTLCHKPESFLPKEQNEPNEKQV